MKEYKNDRLAYQLDWPCWKLNGCHCDFNQLICMYKMVTLWWMLLHWSLVT